MDVETGKNKTTQPRTGLEAVTLYCRTEDGSQSMGRSHLEKKRQGDLYKELEQ